MAKDDGREMRDLVLAPNEYAYILDETKGLVNLFVGPSKTSLSGTDRPVRLDNTTKRFTACSLDESIQLQMAAPEGWYIILKNPAKDNKHPNSGSNPSAPEMEVGRKVNIAGPISFALWPGQMAKVVHGHRLKNNEYLLIRVYDEKAAQTNWVKQAIAIKSPQGGEEEAPKPNVASDVIKSEDLKMGRLLIIKGTDVSFFIPPTGVEVVADTRGGGEFVREAVSLEQIEYCQLVDQNGSKRYERGPKVVFPKPTEKFITAKEEGEEKPSRKFRAIELNPNSGIYIKVIADYSEGGQDFKVGEELFITGKDQPIYFPREEHAIIKYGDEGVEQEIHYGIAIPKGEARYVMDRDSGDINLVKGPSVFLPDPRKQVIVKRIIEPTTCQLLYPGNIEALEYNSALLKETTGFETFDEAAAAGVMFSSNSLQDTVGASAATRGLYDNSHRRFARSAVKKFGGDSFDRKTEYTKPRTITLNSKYDGAVAVGPYIGYAIMVIDKSGKRSVVEGPQTVLLEYDETLQVLELSTGNPKQDNKPLKQVYLRVINNKVSDTISARTKDFCEVLIPLSFRVNFDPQYKEKWFNVENYIKLMTEHMRSKIRNAIMQYSIEEFYRNSTSIIRDTVLGAKVDDERPGVLFEENGMRIYDVEVLDVTLQNKEIQSLITSSERDVINNSLKIAAAQRNLDFVRKTEKINQDILTAQAETRQAKIVIESQDVNDNLKLALVRVGAKAQEDETLKQNEFKIQEILDKITSAMLARTAKGMEQEISFNEKKQKLRIDELMAQVDAAIKQGQIFTPDLIAALQRFGDDDLVKTAIAALGPMGALKIAGGDSIADVLHNIFKGSNLEKMLPQALGGSNGNSAKAATVAPRQ